MNLPAGYSGSALLRSLRARHRGRSDTRRAQSRFSFSAHCHIPRQPGTCVDEFKFARQFAPPSNPPFARIRLVIRFVFLGSVTVLPLQGYVFLTRQLSGRFPSSVPIPNSVSGSSKMTMWSSVLVLLGLSTALAVELTFELPDNAQQCFFEEVKEGTKMTIEFQVIIGGNYDVDVVVHGPNKRELYKQQQKQFDTVPIKADQSGVYSACFSNEFSTFSHKLVYMNFQVGEEVPVGQNSEKQSAMTKMEDSITQIHKNLNTVDDYQTHYRLRELHGRKIAEDLNSQVMWYSAVESFGIITIFLSYIMIMKSFFSDKKSIR